MGRKPTSTRPTPYRRLGAQLRADRERVQLSQQEVADRTGIHQTFFSQIEIGYKRPDADTLRQLARVYDGNLEHYVELAGYVPAGDPDRAMSELADDLAAAAKVIQDQAKIIARMQRRLSEIAHKTGRIRQSHGDG